MWDVATGQNTVTLRGHSSFVLSVVYSPDGQSLASGSADNTVKLWDIATGQNTATLRGHSFVVFSVAFSPDGQTLASGSADKTVKLWDLSVTDEKNLWQNHLNRLNREAPYWHQQQAQIAKEAGNAFAETFHLKMAKKPLILSPTNPLEIGK